MSTISDLDNLTVDRLLVVILNYRTPGLTIDCLRSLESEVKSLPGVHVVITDNASGDDSVTAIGQAIATHGWGDWATFVPLDRNGGYAFGNNAAIRPLLASSNPPPYYLLLNPDTVVHPQAIKTLLDFMDAHPEVGIAGSRLEDPDGSPQRSAFRFPTIFSEVESGINTGFIRDKVLAKYVIAPPVPETTCQTEWVAGASMIIRRQVFADIGLLDEKYFMYFEEVDFCLMALKAGWPCWYVPESRVIHLVGQSSGVTDHKKPPKRLPTYWFDSRRRFFLKHYGLAYTATTDLLWMASFSLSKWRLLLNRKPRIDAPNMLEDFAKNSVFVKGGHIQD
jgi:N-acetylglucosaminyl-diphospho-decaprenol L-rhamnosyltransferase